MALIITGTPESIVKVKANQDDVMPDKDETVSVKPLDDEEDDDDGETDNG